MNKVLSELPSSELFERDPENLTQEERMEFVKRIAATAEKLKKIQVAIHGEEDNADE